jgi:site-specific recombinase XerD
LKTLFLRRFQSYLTTVKGLNPLTVNKITGRVQTVIRYSLENEWIDKFPFYGFKNIKYKKKIIFLSQEDLDKLREYQFAQERLQQVCDGFIFCCYTGLAYAEFKALRSKHLELYKDKWWISMVREKTQESYYVPLLDQAIELILKYSKVENISSLTPEKVLIPCLSNQKMNSYLKEIGDIVGISNVLKTHLARKTFASTVLLSNGVPMHVTSRLLNHSSVTVTEGYYGVLVRDKLLEEIEKVENELKKIKS